MLPSFPVEKLFHANRKVHPLEKSFNVNKHGHCHMKTKETFLSLKFIQKNKNIKEDTFEAIFLSF
jgi:hypothetical protein